MQFNYVQDIVSSGIGINDSIELEGDYWKRLEPTPYNQVVATAKLHITEIVQQAKEENICLILTSLLPIHIPILMDERSRKIISKS